MGENTTNKELGKFIRRRRRVMKLTQPELAEKAGLRITTISEYENGKRNIPWSSLSKVFEALKVKRMSFRIITNDGVFDVPIV